MLAESRARVEAVVAQVSFHGHLRILSSIHVVHSFSSPPRLESSTHTRQTQLDRQRFIAPRGSVLGAGAGEGGVPSHPSSPLTPPLGNPSTSAPSPPFAPSLDSVATDGVRAFFTGLGSSMGYSVAHAFYHHARSPPPTAMGPPALYPTPPGVAAGAPPFGVHPYAPSNHLYYQGSSSPASLPQPPWQQPLGHQSPLQPPAPKEAVQRKPQAAVPKSGAVAALAETLTMPTALRQNKQSSQATPLTKQQTQRVKRRASSPEAAEGSGGSVRRPATSPRDERKLPLHRSNQPGAANRPWWAKRANELRRPPRPSPLSSSGSRKKPLQLPAISSEDEESTMSSSNHASPASNRVKKHLQEQRAKR